MISVQLFLTVNNGPCMRYDCVCCTTVTVCKHVSYLMLYNFSLPSLIIAILLYFIMSVVPQFKSLKHLVKSTISSNLKGPAVIDNSVIEGNFTFNNCKDVHVGPKYEHNSSIVIKNISVPNIGELPQEIQSSIIDKGDLLSYSTDNVCHKYCITQFSHSNIRAIISLLALVIIIIFITALLIIYIFNKKMEDDPKYTGTMIEGPDWKENYPTDRHFVLRQAWGAAQSSGELANNTLPLNRVIFIHTAGPGTCNKFFACKDQMQSIQEMHIRNNFGDIGYNFVIGSDGYIYVGVGWDKVGAHTQTYNYGSLGVAFIGDFRRDEPNDLMLSAAKTLLEFGVQRGKVEPEYELFGHCQIHLAFPESPGKNVMTQIQKWSHWNDTNTNRCAG